jgi:Mg-chelatase subunit ChlD
MPIRLDYPIFLLLLPLVVVGLMLTRQRVLSLWGWRRDLSAGLRFVAATGFAVALAQPGLRVADDAASVVIAVDESASMSPSALRAAQTWIDQSLRTRRNADRVGLVAFAGDVQVIQPLSTSDIPPRLPDPASLKPGTTDLAQALRVSAGLVRGASNPRVVLLSDGVATGGDLGLAGRRIRPRCRSNPSRGRSTFGQAKRSTARSSSTRPRSARHVCRYRSMGRLPANRTSS